VDPDPGGPKTCGSGSRSGSATLFVTLKKRGDLSLSLWRTHVSCLREDDGEHGGAQLAVDLRHPHLHLLNSHSNSFLSQLEKNALSKSKEKNFTLSVPGLYEIYV
jgi:hypothetical protein